MARSNTAGGCLSFLDNRIYLSADSNEREEQEMQVPLRVQVRDLSQHGYDLNEGSTSTTFIPQEHGSYF